MSSRPSTSGRDLFAVHMVTPNLIWVAGERSVLLHWDGFEWLAESVRGRNRDINGLWIDPTGSEGWAVGNGGLVLRYQ